MNRISRDDRFLSPAETARRLGVSIKALRLYEKHGLVSPLRSVRDWRAYGPEQLARLHQVLALKQLGLPLAQIARVLADPETSLASVLALQERALNVESTRLHQALALIRAARTRIETGETLSIDDLTQLTKETTMSTKTSPEEMKAIFDPISAKYFTPEESAALSARKFDQQAIGAQWEALIAEAKALMAKGDPASPESRDLARRWMALVSQFTQGNQEVADRVKQVWMEAMSDPKNAAKLPLTPEIFAFVGRAWESVQKG